MKIHWCEKCKKRPKAKDVETGEYLRWCRSCIHEWVDKNLMNRLRTGAFAGD